MTIVRLFVVSPLVYNDMFNIMHGFLSLISISNNTDRLCLICSFQMLQIQLQMVQHGGVASPSNNENAEHTKND